MTLTNGDERFDKSRHTTEGFRFGIRDGGSAGRFCKNDDNGLEGFVLALIFR